MKQIYIVGYDTDYRLYPNLASANKIRESKSYLKLTQLQLVGKEHILYILSEKAPIVAIESLSIALAISKINVNLEVVEIVM